MNFVTGGHYFIFISSFIHYVQRMYNKNDASKNSQKIVEQSSRKDKLSVQTQC